MLKKRWYGINFNYLHKNADKIIKCKDYVPLHLLPYLDYDERINFLKENGLYNEVCTIEKNKRETFEKSPNKFKWVKKDILEFVENHKEYDEILL